MAILLSLALVACSSSDGTVSSSEEEPTSATPSSGTEEPSTTRTTESSSTEPSSTEPSSSTPSLLACAALECEASNRACEEGSGDTDAACTSCLTGYGEVDGECRALPATPANLEAGTDDPEAVALSWEAVPGATSYRVYRDGDFLAVVASPGHVDTAADAPTRPGVEDLSAVGHLEEVVLSWSAPESEAGMSHSYQVSAVAELESERSAGVEGRRAALSLLDYRVEVEQEAPIIVSSLGWTDTEAPGPTLAAPLALTASQGTRFDAVELTVTLPQVLPGAARTYFVTPRWGSAESAQEGASAQVSAGRSVPPEMEVLVEWADGDSWVIVDFSDPVLPPYPPETTIGFEDPTAPTDGSSRTYRAKGMGDGLEELSQTAEGWFGEPLELGEACSADGLCPLGTWCPTDTSERYCSPRPIVEGVAIPFQWVPSGLFIMGSPERELGRFAAREEQVLVELTRDYFVQRTPVTQGQWAAVMSAWNELPEAERTMSGWSGTTPEFGTAPSYYALPEDEIGQSNCDDSSCPVERVNWWDAVVYANALSLLEGLEPCYTLADCRTGSNLNAVGGGCGSIATICFSAELFRCGSASFVGKSCSGYRLLTDAEWERAARAGTTTATYLGNLSGVTNTCSSPPAQPNLDPIAWWCGNGGSSTHAVGQRAPNGWGLYDMLGNVWEMTWTRYSDALSAGTDPLGPATGMSRVFRGGAWSSTAQGARSALRAGDSPINRFNSTGFRLARTAP